jgi:hypothetical protein
MPEVLALKTFGLLPRAMRGLPFDRKCDWARRSQALNEIALNLNFDDLVAHGFPVAGDSDAMAARALLERTEFINVPVEIPAALWERLTEALCYAA